MGRIGNCTVGRLYLSVIGALLAALVATGSGLRYQSKQLDALRGVVLGLQIELATAKAVATDLMEDKQSDATVDNIPDSGLNSVPPWWMRETDAD